MSYAEETYKIVRGKLRSIAPNDLADEIAKVYTAITGDTYDCYIDTVSYDGFGMKVSFSIHQRLERGNSGSEETAPGLNSQKKVDTPIKSGQSKS